MVEDRIEEAGGVLCFGLRLLFSREGAELLLSPGASSSHRLLRSTGLWRAVFGCGASSSCCSCSYASEGFISLLSVLVSLYLDYRVAWERFLIFVGGEGGGLISAGTCANSGGD